MLQQNLFERHIVPSTQFFRFRQQKPFFSAIIPSKMYAGTMLVLPSDCIPDNTDYSFKMCEASDNMNCRRLTAKAINFTATKDRCRHYNSTRRLHESEFFPFQSQNVILSFNHVIVSLKKACFFIGLSLG